MAPTACAGASTATRRARGPTPERVEGSSAMSTAVDHRRADMVAGFLCAFSFALSGIAIVHNPGLLAPVSILVALIAVRMSDARRTLAAWALAIAGLAFFLVMLVAVSTDTPLF
jgi:hypothetical protein